MNILFCGGGTLGSVTPLLAVFEKMRETCLLRREPLFASWIGTRSGPERELVERAGIPFYVCTAGKVRRYVDVRTIIAPILFFAGCIQAFILILRLRPSVIMNAASFVGVPVIIAGWILRKKIIILQIDIVPSLSNLLAAPFAHLIGVAVRDEMNSFNPLKTRIVGVPVRSIKTGDAVCEKLRASVPMDTAGPFIYITGGGTGAGSLNELVWQSLSYLEGVGHIIHVTGKDKFGQSNVLAKRFPCYHPYEFLSDTSMAFSACADIVVTRAGIGTLSELSYLGKPTIIIPLLHSQQEKNADYAFQRKAAHVLSHASLTPEMFAASIRDLLEDRAERETLSKNISTLFPQNASRAVVDLVYSLL